MPGSVYILNCEDNFEISFAGDYILVWGDADEDGFFDGELLDGRRGLVPSNFVEKLEGEELLDFHRQVQCWFKVTLSNEHAQIASFKCSFQ